MAGAVIDTSGVEAYMQAMVHLRKGMAKPKSWKYTCIEDFVLANGKSFAYKPLPKCIKRGESKMCYMNAYQLMLDRRDLTYVEGFAAGIIPVAHAWCVDKRGRVYDRTWADGAEYFGVKFDRLFVLKTICQRQHYGILDDWENEWPLIRGVSTKFLAEA